MLKCVRPRFKDHCAAYLGYHACDQLVLSFAFDEL